MELTRTQHYANVYIVHMKNKKKNILQRPFHLHVEYFFRKQYFLLAVLGLMGIALIKSDGRMLGMMRDAYNHGYGLIGVYLREETARTPLTFQVTRVPAISSK